MTALDVTAVIFDAATEQEAICREALSAQDDPVSAVIAGPQALAEASRTTGAWLWLLQGGAAPRPDALARLAAARDVGDVRGSASLLAALVVGPDGSPSAPDLPAGTEHDTDAVVALAAHRVLPIRRAGLACTLVAASALADHGLPDARFGVHAGHEWSARVLRDAQGLFVPLAVAELRGARRTAPGWSDLSVVLRVARTPTWTRGEMLRTLVATFAR